jgi:hypothetical protein
VSSAKRARFTPKVRGVSLINRLYRVLYSRVSRTGLNFYRRGDCDCDCDFRRFLRQATATQAPLHDVLSGSRVKGSHPIAWTPELHKAFEECKASLSRATLLAHPDPAAPLGLVTDVSTSAIGAVLQQRVDNARQPLAFFSKKLNTAQQK